MRQRPRRDDRGETLIELLVAVMIMATAVVAIVGATATAIHLSDIHIWRYALNPLRLFNKRAVGMAELVLGRSRKFRLERLQSVVDRVLSLAPDHILITGDLTTTALPAEFRAARKALADLLVDSSRVTVIPGNHDRYTIGSVRHRQFEEWFGEVGF